MQEKIIRVIFIFLSLFVVYNFSFGQVSGGNTTVIVENTDHILVQKEDSLYVKYLNGNIKMYHAGSYFYADTAVIRENDFEAFGHIVILQDDGTTVFADTIYYDGDSLLSSLTGRVLLRKEDKTLRTRVLDYDVGNKIGRYKFGAQLTQDSSLLKSLEGVYFVREDKVQFRHHVSVIDSSFTLKTDSLDFNTRTKVVRFLSPTFIIQDSSSIYCEKGFYDIGNKKASFEQNPLYREKDVVAKGEKIIFEDAKKSYKLAGNAYYKDQEQEAKADTIIYFSDNEKTILIGNVDVKGKHNQVTGQYVEYYNETGEFISKGRGTITENEFRITADNFDIKEGELSSVASGNVVFIDTISKMELYCETIASGDDNKRFKAYSDSLSRPLMKKLMDTDTLYLCSDTLFSYEKIVGQDTFQLFNAFHKVQIFHHNFSGICDSLHFNGQDSVFTLTVDPFMWRDTTQFSADTIKIQLKNDKVSELTLINNSLIIEAEDGGLFNQIGGKNLVAGFENDTLRTMAITGNAQSLYYMKDDENRYSGAILTSCSRIFFLFRDDDIKDIKYYEKPESKMTPMAKELENPQRLTGFNWKIDQKPFDVHWLMQTWNEERKTAVKKLWPTKLVDENHAVQEAPGVVPPEPIRNMSQKEKTETKSNENVNENK